MVGDTSNETAPAGVDPGIPFDTICSLLMDGRRRTLLSRLYGRDRPVTIDRLAADVAAAERRQGAPSAAERDRVHRSLYHVHLPKLAAHDVVSYDCDRDVIELTGSGESLLQYWQALRVFDG